MIKASGIITIVVNMFSIFLMIINHMVKQIDYLSSINELGITFNFITFILASITILFGLVQVRRKRVLFSVLIIITSAINLIISSVYVKVFMIVSIIGGIIGIYYGIKRRKYN
jgi:hypothetical protein